MYFDARLMLLVFSQVGPKIDIFNSIRSGHHIRRVQRRTLADFPRGKPRPRRRRRRTASRPRARAHEVDVGDRHVDRVRQRVRRGGRVTTAGVPVRRFRSIAN